MRNLFKYCLLFIWFTLCFFCGTSAQAKDYEYKNLDIIARIGIDGSIDVEEIFTTNFLEYRHGIIRMIPLNYSVLDNDFHIKVYDISVKGNKFTNKKRDGNVEIKIGDEDKTLIGEKIYSIYYSVYGLIRDFSNMGYSELYWNLLGNDFDTNINSVRVDLYLPKIYTGLSNDDFLITADGISQTVKDYGGTIEWGRGDKITIIYDKVIPAWQALTLSVRFPNGYFELDKSKQAKLVGHVSGNHFFEIFLYIFGELPFGFYFIVFLAIIVVIGKIFRIDWSKILDYEIKIFDDKDSKIENKLKIDSSIVAQYTSPKGVNCAEAGMLYNCTLEPTDLTSLLYKWLIEGLISIEIDDDKHCSASGNSSMVRRFIMTKLKNIDENRPAYELDFFKALLPGSINSKKVVSPASNFDIVRSLKSLRNYGKKQGWIVVGYFDDSMEYISRLLVFGISFCFFYFCDVCGFFLSLFVSLLVILPMIFLCKNSSPKVYISGFVVFCLFFCVFFLFCLDLFGSLVVSFFLSAVLALPMIGMLANSDQSKKPIQKMIYLSDVGKELALQVIGYAKFLRACDENKFRLFLQQDPTFFDKALPFAVAFGFSTDFINKATPVLKELDMRPVRFNFDIDKIYSINDTFMEIETRREKEKSERFGKSKRIADYDSDGGFSSGSSFGGGFSHGGGGGGGGSRSW